jgi:hypothetical protein
VKVCWEREREDETERESQRKREPREKSTYLLWNIIYNFHSLNHHRGAAERNGPQDPYKRSTEEEEEEKSSRGGAGAGVEKRAEWRALLLPLFVAVLFVIVTQLVTVAVCPSLLPRLNMRGKRRSRRRRWWEKEERRRKVRGEKGLLADTSCNYGHQLQYTVFQTHCLFDDIRLYSSLLFRSLSSKEMKRPQEPSLVDREERKNISDEFSQMF